MSRARYAAYDVASRAMEELARVGREQRLPACQSVELIGLERHVFTRWKHDLNRMKITHLERILDLPGVDTCYILTGVRERGGESG